MKYSCYVTKMIIKYFHFITVLFKKLFDETRRNLTSDVEDQRKTLTEIQGNIFLFLLRQKSHTDVINKLD